MDLKHELKNRSMNRIAVVTGGSKGIGNAICRQLAEHGFTVILTARDEARATTAAGNIKGDVIARKLDVNNMSDAKALAGFIEKTYGRLDVLVNNAGLISTDGATEADMEETREIMDTNFLGPWQVTIALLPLLKKSDDARIINMSSEMGAMRELVGGYAAYRLSKHALNALTILMSKELDQTTIKVNAMHPGWVRTDMGGANAPRSADQGADTAVWLATAPKIPTGKFFKDRKEIEW